MRKLSGVLSIMKNKKKFFLLSAIAGGIVIILAVVLFMLNLVGKAKPTLVNKENPSVSIDIFDRLYQQIKLSDYVSYGDYETLSFSVTTSDSEALTFSQIGKDTTVIIYLTGKAGDFKVSVGVKENETAANVLLAFNINVTVIDTSPDPELLGDIDNMNIEAPAFANSSATYAEKTIDLSKYFMTTKSTVFSVTSEDSGITSTVDPDNKLTLVFTDYGQKKIKVAAMKNDVEVVSTSFTVTLTKSVPTQLINGDFESGWTGWNIDNWVTAAYSIYDSKTDIWGNNVCSNKHYLYGYYDEAGTTKFASSSFLMSGSGIITWKMAGNSTPDLKLTLMKHNNSGEDEEVAEFNNWYYGKYGQSAFIFRNYWYQVDMDKYGGSEMYFIVSDDRTEDFGFICLDDIVTHYDTAPDTKLLYNAGFVDDPNGSVLDKSDTSASAFTNLADVSYQLPNGDFESGYDHWFMTAAEKEAYAIYDLPVDIWSNPVNGTKHYLSGFQNEAAVTNFHSDLFKVGGTGLITWKMAGNSTADLQFVLMKYNESGEDEVVDKFNNWYYPISQESGFVFRNYWYQIDLSKYAGSYMYFVVKDSKAKDFGFINLDDIVTNYESIPAFNNLWYKAGYVKQPKG